MPRSPIGANDTLLVTRERGPVMLDEIGWRLPGLARPGDAPIVALPVFIRHELRAMAFYGSAVETNLDRSLNFKV